MKAIVCRKYGLLELEEVEEPLLKDNEVLVEVHASSVTVHNLGLVRGKPFLVRLMGTGLLKPRIRTPGSDFAGRVKSVGRNVKQLNFKAPVTGLFCGERAFFS
jgi:NADPH:quinone reductase-like Zn-dependent oxidoreductase